MNEPNNSIPASTPAGDDLPGMPSDDEIRREIRSRDIINMPTLEKPRSNLDRSDLSPTALARLEEAKLELGPGKHADAYDIALHDQFRMVRDHINVLKRLEREHDQVDGYDPASGEPIYSFSEKRRAAMREEAAQRREDIERIQGPLGLRKLEEAREQAIEQAKAAFRRQHVKREAERLVEQITLDEQIKERVHLLLKSRGKADYAASMN
jgi:hypothetical protein